jgi:biopolymer transport protein ExbB/biopolymer transport protein TolQ
MLGNVGWIGGAVMLSLIALSVISVGVIVDKHRRMRSAIRQSQEFRTAFARFLHGGQPHELLAAARQHENSHVAHVVEAGLVEYDAVRKSGGDPAASMELVEGALEDSKAEMLMQMKGGLGFLATIASTAPFIGLFGTVVGIINAFHAIAAAGSGGMAVVSGGIAEALITTGMGIFVAIPAVVGFNYFTGKIDNCRVEMNRASTQMVSHLLKMPEPARDPKVRGIKEHETAYALR